MSSSHSVSREDIAEIYEARADNLEARGSHTGTDIYNIARFRHQATEVRAAQNLTSAGAGWPRR